MGTYRQTRNIEASIVDHLSTELDANWTGIQVEKTFARIYGLTLPAVCIRVGDTSHNKAEIGEDSTIRTVQILIDIFASNDGQRLDIKDFIVDKIKSGCVYYEYVVANGAVSSKIENGRVRITEIIDVGVNFDADKDVLDPHDRYRTLITLSASLGRVEL